MPSGTDHQCTCTAQFSSSKKERKRKTRRSTHTGTAELGYEPASILKIIHKSRGQNSLDMNPQKFLFIEIYNLDEGAEQGMECWLVP